MVKCPSNTFDIKQVEKYVLQQSNSNEYTSYVDLTDRVVKVESAFQFTQGSALQSFLVGRIYDEQNYCFTVLSKIMLFKVNLTTLQLFFSSKYSLSVLKDCKSRILLTVLEES